ncbi:unnamed protein product [Acanthoscelides obtectus]|uniref:Uncharacterized protein n=1 Tax=Acanthoscelides obtectus TaxID=200917 RepID=A0A9P0KZY0_ACAOB|nr:unnamed protein product [Acanthoscelides obtectus]CAK1674555.1 hypothetical protein AOBTE_LOCUS29657 [Acanthoscelides obtectus]
MASTSTMETDQPAATKTKRARDEIVDPDDGTSISSAMKSRIQPETEKKVKCLKYIIYFYEKLKILLPKELDPGNENINLAAQITNVIHSIFNILRQRANGQIGSSEKKASEKKMFTLTSKGKTYSIKKYKAPIKMKF